MPKSTKHAKAKKLIHPNSRKAHRIGAKEIHNDKIKKVHRATSLKQTVLQEKLMWVKEHMDESRTVYSKKDLCELVEWYLSRFDEELEQINIVQGISDRKSKQHAARESAIRLTLDKEKRDFETCGIEMPDLCNGKAMKIFKLWQGETKYLQNIKLQRVTRMADTACKVKDGHIDDDEDDDEHDELARDEEDEGEEKEEHGEHDGDDDSNVDGGNGIDDKNMENT